MYHGIRKEMPGIRRAINMNIDNRFCLNRAIEYAAGRPIRSENATAEMPIIEEFMKYLRKFCSLKTLS
jgi:hypothetical protein